MHVLVVGGTRFVGRFLAFRLLARGHRVTLLNRGTMRDPFGDGVERLRADRTTDDFARVLAGRKFDACVDFAAYDAPDIAGVIAHAKVEHYVFISTGSVYLVRDGAPAACREEDYDGKILPRPDNPRDVELWEYGTKKRACEDALEAAWQKARFPATRLRIPVVNGERDYHSRMVAYIAKVARGDTVLLPDGGQTPMRHVYGDDVARVAAQILGDDGTFGRAYNLAQDEAPTLAELVALIAEKLGTTARTEVLPRATLEARGVDLAAVSPFSTQMSFLETSRAKREIGFRPTPLDDYLGRIVASFMAQDAPPS